MDNVRILKGYSKEERKELEKAKDNYFVSAIELIKGIARNDDNCIYLARKYAHESPDEDNQLARDIADYYDGNAKFPDKKYYVHDKVTDQYIYYSMTEWSLRWGRFNVAIDIDMPDEKTKEEWLAINPAYEAMLEEVEDDE